MASKIKMGSAIQVKVVKTPTNVAGRKTLERLLSKDAAVKAENARLRKARKTHLRIAKRGGRDWEINVPKQHPIRGLAGECGTITATADVLTDLASVSKFVEVTPA